jgi:hypothetical protein
MRTSALIALTLPLAAAEPQAARPAARPANTDTMPAGSFCCWVYEMASSQSVTISRAVATNQRRAAQRPAEVVVIDKVTVPTSD